jgi:2-methylcitrate dehydratase PrpD
MLADAAAWAVAAQTAPLPDEAVHHAKRAIVDWMAAVVPGGVMAPAQILAAALVDDRQKGDAALLPSGQTVPLRTAALVNGTAAHTAEVDDIFRDGVYHPGAPTISAALAAAQDLGRTGEDFVRAVVVGFELSTRVAATIQPAHYRFWHTTGTVGTLGAAAAVATLLRLGAEAVVHAVANATTMAAGLQQAFRSDAMSKPLHAGHAAEAGALAALAASKGFTGVADILEGDSGFGAAMSDAPSWDAVFADLGDYFNITEMTFKNHACCGHTFAAVDGAIELRDAIDVDRIQRVDVATYGTALGVAGNPDPTTDFEAKFSIPFVVATALRYGSVRLEAFTDDRLADAALRELVGRVQLSVDPDLDAGFPGQRGARVIVTLEDGSTHESMRPTRKGDPDLPLTDEELSDKYRELVAPHLGDGPTDELAEALWSLEQRDDLRGLVPSGFDRSAA